MLGSEQRVSIGLAIHYIFVSQKEAAKREEELAERICALEALVDDLRQDLKVCRRGPRAG